jgi:hypothetical protein
MFGQVLDILELNSDDNEKIKKCYILFDTVLSKEAIKNKISNNKSLSKLFEHFESNSNTECIKSLKTVNEYKERITFHLSEFKENIKLTQDDCITKPLISLRKILTEYEQETGLSILNNPNIVVNDINELRKTVEGKIKESIEDILANNNEKIQQETSIDGENNSIISDVTASKSTGKSKQGSGLENLDHKMKGKLRQLNSIINKKKNLKELMNKDKDDPNIPSYPLAPDVSRKKSDIFRMETEEDGDMKDLCRGNTLRSNRDSLLVTEVKFYAEREISFGEVKIDNNDNNKHIDNSGVNKLRSLNSFDDEFNPFNKLISKNSRNLEIDIEDHVLKLKKNSLVIEEIFNDDNQSKNDDGEGNNIEEKIIKLDIQHQLETKAKFVKKPSMFNPMLETFAIIEKMENTYSPRRSRIIDMSQKSLITGYLIL